MRNSMVLFVANKDGKNISFHLWDGQSHIAVPFDSDDAELCRPMPSYASAPRFMPSLQELHFCLQGKGNLDHRYCEYLGWKYLSSLRKIMVKRPYNPDCYCGSDLLKVEKVGEAMKRAANEHPNRPKLHLDKGSYMRYIRTLGSSPLTIFHDYFTT